MPPARPGPCKTSRAESGLATVVHGPVRHGTTYERAGLGQVYSVPGQIVPGPGRPGTNIWTSIFVTIHSLIKKNIPNTYYAASCVRWSAATLFYKNPHPFPPGNTPTEAHPSTVSSLVRACVPRLVFHGFFTGRAITMHGLPAAAARASGAPAQSPVLRRLPPLLVKNSENVAAASVMTVHRL